MRITNGSDERNTLERGCLLGLWQAILEMFVDKRRRRDEQLAAEVLDDPSNIADFELLLVGEGSKNRTLPCGKRPRRLYISGVIATVKNVVGTPVRNAANLLVVRRLCRQAMEEHGLRPTHIASVLPFCIEAVFVQSEYEFEAQSWGQRIRSGGGKRFASKAGEPRV